MRAALISLSLLASVGVSLPAGAADAGFRVLADSDRAVTVETPAGIHVNAKAPLFLAVGGGASVAGDASGADGDGRFALSAPLRPGDAVRLDFALCDDGETWCRFYKLAFAYDPAAPEQVTQAATAALDPAAAPRPHHPGLLDFAIQDDADAAFARASAEGKLVLMDFHAIWCPPCQMLAAEGMRDPAVRALVDGLVVVQLDADQPQSWPAKGRYSVRGYPTIILARADGTEIGRLEGYPGTAELRRWLDSGIKSGRSLRELAALRAEGDDAPQTLAALARQLDTLGLSQEAVASWEAALPGLSGDDALDARLALLVDAARRGDKRDLRDHLDAAALLAPDSPRVMYALYEATSVTPTGSVRLDNWIIDRGAEAAARIIAASADDPARRADAQEGAALFFIGQGEEAAAVAASSAAADAWLEVLAAQPGQGAERFAAFRGQARSLTADLADAGRAQEAEALHRELVAAFPDEMTYHYDFARFLKGADRLPEAEAESRAAVTHASGDNLLWATAQLADLLIAQGKTEEARALLQATLDAVTLPADPTIRTHRYVERLRKQLDGLNVSPQAAG